MNTGMRLQVVVSSVEDWAATLGGNALRAVASDAFRQVKQVAMVLLLDKTNIRDTELAAIAPAVSAQQLGHILRIYGTLPDNPDAVSVTLLRALPVRRCSFIPVSASSFRLSRSSFFVARLPRACMRSPKRLCRRSRSLRSTRGSPSWTCTWASSCSRACRCPSSCATTGPSPSSAKMMG